jgi:hypothetical protein
MGAPPEVGMSSAHANSSGKDPTEMEVRALMKVLIGVDPHQESVAVAVVDEAKGELIERASFPQDRSGLRALERFKRNGSPSAALSGGERRRARSAPSGKVGSGRRVCGGRSTQAFGEG